MGWLIAEAALAAYADVSLPEVLQPVPITRRRRWQRGYNQSVLLADAIGAQIGIPRINAARRVRHTRQQGASRTERARNVSRAFTTRAPPIDGRRIAIVDDVVTTTATVAALARSLRRAGAREVHVWAVARAG